MRHNDDDNDDNNDNEIHSFGGGYDGGRGLDVDEGAGGAGGVGDLADVAGGGDLGESMMAVVGLLTELVSTRDEITTRQGELESSLANLASSFVSPRLDNVPYTAGDDAEPVTEKRVIKVEDDDLEEEEIR